MLKSKGEEKRAGHVLDSGDLNSAHGVNSGKRCVNACVMRDSGALLTQLGPFFQQSDDDRSVAAADGAVEGPHAAVVHVLNHSTALHQVVHLQQQGYSYSLNMP